MYVSSHSTLFCPRTNHSPTFLSILSLSKKKKREGIKRREMKRRRKHRNHMLDRTHSLPEEAHRRLKSRLIQCALSTPPMNRNTTKKKQTIKQTHNPIHPYIHPSANPIHHRKPV